MANSNIPMLEAQKRADRDAVNGGQIVNTWAGQQAASDLQRQQQRNQFAPAPTYTPSSPAEPIRFSTTLSSGTQTPPAFDGPIEFCARAGALLMVVLALAAEGATLGTLIGWGLIGAAGGAVLGCAVAAAKIMLVWLWKAALWGAVVLFVLQLFA